ncbi:MAG: KH domain-containing protein [Dictyoglomus sp.]|nr:KH domain-containing protein [Dictyoglomus sp.]MCX7941601.1 KH domain-containing protein [Dictyoglomaceae bacterium]MDW8187780.1 KH domain-containing protein [Dictyoglomus sp.]PMQ01307.1 MAG: RNA-binding protein [Dictyoglomus sp. NZ13-RE01]
MKELLEYIIKAIVQHPEEVEVREVEGTKSVILEVKVAPEDRGRVIGKQGQTVKALQTIVRVAGLKKGKKVVIEVLQ